MTYPFKGYTYVYVYSPVRFYLPEKQQLMSTNFSNGFIDGRPRGLCKSSGKVI